MLLSLDKNGMETNQFAYGIKNPAHINTSSALSKSWLFSFEKMARRLFEQPLLGCPKVEPTFSTSILEK